MVLPQRRRPAVKTVFAVLAAVLAASSGPIGGDQPPAAGRGGAEDPDRFLAGAIDIHVHPSTHEWLVDSLGPFKEATETYFRTSIPVRSVDEMADEFRNQDVLAVLFASRTWSASRWPASRCSAASI